MLATERLPRIIALTSETVDSALLELEGTPAPLGRRTGLLRFGWTKTITPLSVVPDRNLINPVAE
jgi:hypothetical protein